MVGQLTDEATNATPLRNTVSNFYEQFIPFSLHALEHHPDLSKPLLLFGALSAGAFLGNTLLDGLQEAWVRWEESCIRAQLVDRLGNSFAQSIQLKNKQDDANKQAAILRLNTDLQAVGLPPLAAIQAQGGEPTKAASMSQKVAHNQFFYMPQSRQPFGETPASPPRTHPLNNRYWLLHHAKPLVSALALGAGALTGYLGYFGLNSALKPVPLPAERSASTQLKNYLNARDYKALWLNLSSEGRWRPLAGAIALGSLLGIAKLFITGLREIEVTRLNAETEYQYENYKWLDLDTRYHNVAESTQLNHALDRFEATLPQVAKTDPQQAIAEAHHIVDQVGYWSPPPYYPITPSVQLVTARS